MNVLVVGGAGYIGGAVVDSLLEAGHSPIVFDSLLYEESYRKPVEFVYGDIRNRGRIEKYLARADVVIWLAALVGDGACAVNPEVTIEINQKPVEWLAENYDGRIIFLSTCSVYGAQHGLLDETSATNPLSAYAVTKLAAERALSSKEALIFRLGTLFGMGDSYSRIRLDLVVNILTVRAFFERRVTVFGGDQYRPLLHVRDVARAVADNVDNHKSGVYNLHRENVRIIELAERIRSHFPDLLVERSEMRFEDARNYQVSSDRARQELGFCPMLSIDDGVREVKSLVESSRIKDVENPRYANHAFLALHRPHIRIVGAD